MEEIARAHKDHFADLLRSCVSERTIDFVGEEADPAYETHASRLGPKYRQIDMPAEERKKRGIPKDYAGNKDYRDSDRKCWDTQRERFMFDQVTDHHGFEHVFLICGSNHVEALGKLFSQAGYVVSTEDVTQAKWFDPFVSQFV